MKLLRKGERFAACMATQRIASASIRGAANAKKSLTTLGAASGSQKESRRWKSTPAIGLDNNTSILKGELESLLDGDISCLLNY